MDGGGTGEGDEHGAAGDGQGRIVKREAGEVFVLQDAVFAV